MPSIVHNIDDNPQVSLQEIQASFQLSHMIKISSEDKFLAYDLSHAEALRTACHAAVLS